MQPTINKIALIATPALTVAALLARLLTLPQVQNEAVGETGVSLWLLLGLCLAAVLLAALSCLSPQPLRPMGGKQQTKLGLLAGLSGIVMLMDTILSVVRLALTGKTPPPNAQILNSADRTTLTLSLIFGLLGGVWLLLLGCKWLRRAPLRFFARLGSLFPVAWIWCRLARYELSYASAANIKRSFYDFFMLLFMMLFLLAFARYVADVAPPSGKTMRALSAITAMVGISSPLARLGMQILADTESFNASQLAGITDLAIGLLALGMTFFLFAQDWDNPLTDEESPDSLADLVSDQQYEWENPISATPITDQLLAELMEEENVPRLFLLDDLDDE